MRSVVLIYGRRPPATADAAGRSNRCYARDLVNIRTGPRRRAASPDAGARCRVVHVVEIFSVGFMRLEIADSAPTFNMHNRGTRNKKSIKFNSPYYIMVQHATPEEYLH